MTSSIKTKKLVYEYGALLCLVAFVILFPSLWTHSKFDPAWSHSHQNGQINNIVGTFGAYLSDVLFSFWGYSSYWFPVLFLVVAHDMWRRAHLSQEELAKINLFDWVESITFAILLHASSIFEAGMLKLNGGHLPKDLGGFFGQFFAPKLIYNFGYTISTLVLFGIIVLSLSWFLAFSWMNVAEKIGFYVHKWWHRQLDKQSKIRQPDAESKPKTTQHNALALLENKIQYEAIQAAKKFERIPTLDIWQSAAQKNYTSEDTLRFSAKIIEHRLKGFGIEAKVVGVHGGPVITMYELELPAGTKSNPLVHLEKDLARELGVLHLQVIPNLPNKTTIGLEIPNIERHVIRMKELISHMPNTPAAILPMVLGVDKAGAPVYDDLSKMLHVLIAGTTGSGKSVCVHSILISLIAKMLPQQLRLVLMDPKMIELSNYRHIPHLLTPIITDVGHAMHALEWLVQEMENRFNMMSQYMVRNITSYNQQLQDPLWVAKHNIKQKTPMPYIVVVVDELADLMLMSAKSIENHIVRLAQKARAAGIHLILATQRPTADVVTGLIKANIPSRIALQVASKLDSRIILDQAGAENLLGNGDMLYGKSGQMPQRVHGVWLDDEEIFAVTEFWRKQGEPNYLKALLPPKILEAAEKEMNEKSNLPKNLENKAERKTS